MCIPAFHRDGAAGTDPARLAGPENATNPGNVTCPGWGKRRSLHPLSPVVGMGLLEQLRYLYGAPHPPEESPPAPGGSEGWLPRAA